MLLFITVKVLSYVVNRLGPSSDRLTRFDDYLG